MTAKPRRTAAQKRLDLLRADYQRADAINNRGHLYYCAPAPEHWPESISNAEYQAIKRRWLQAELDEDDPTHPALWRHIRATGLALLPVLASPTSHHLWDLHVDKQFALGQFGSIPDEAPIGWVMDDCGQHLIYRLGDGDRQASCTAVYIASLTSDRAQHWYLYQPDGRATGRTWQRSTPAAIDRAIVDYRAECRDRAEQERQRRDAERRAYFQGAVSRLPQEATP